MLLRPLTTAILIALTFRVSAQTAGAPPQSNPAPSLTNPAPVLARKAPKPEAEAAPGGATDKVWVNTNSSVYHCPGGRFYGKTAHGRYMTEAAAKSAGAHAVGGRTCFSK